MSARHAVAKGAAEALVSKGLDAASRGASRGTSIGAAWGSNVVVGGESGAEAAAAHEK